jgi:RNase P protein component
MATMATIANKKKDEALEEICDAKQLNKLYSKSCGNNKQQLRIELENRAELAETPDQTPYLYPILDDPNFNIKIAQKEEFYDTKYDGSIHDVEEYSNILSAAEYELLPQQAFVRNFLSLQTPYNSLLLFHGLGSGKTCSAIGVCEEMRDYLQQMGINKHIIIVASPNVQDNFKLQLFDERKLKEVDGIWTMKGCLGNKLLKEINPTSMKGLKREKVIQQVKNLINASYSFRGYLQFSNEIAKVADPNTSASSSSSSMKQKIFNLQQEYSDSLIVIDEVHNIRISDDNENKTVAKNLMFLVSVVSNLRLLLLSATPMFNSYKEIVWLLNLMNMNDRRGIVTTSDIFDKNGKFKVDSDGSEIGKEIFIRKATGYVSHVRGENPYTFPFRVYPDRFSPDNTFKDAAEYPNYQINGKMIPKEKKIEKLSLYLTAIGEYQQMGYNYIVDRLRNRGDFTSVNRQGREQRRPTFSNLKSFGYTDLQIPIEALNIVYPIFGLEQLMETIQPFDEIKEDLVEDLEEEDLAPVVSEEKEIVEEIDDAIENGPQLSEIVIEPKSELESDPVIDEGSELNMLQQLEELEPEPKPKPPKRKKKTTQIEFEIADKEMEIIELKKELKECEGRLQAKQDQAKQEQVSKEPIEEIVPKKREPKPRRPRKNLAPSVAVATQSSALYNQPLEARKSALHIVEGETHTNLPTEYNEVVSHDTPKMKTNTNTVLGGAKSDRKSANEILDIDPKDLTGGQGLKRIMNFIDSKTPSIKGQFEYKRDVPHVFSRDEIGKYSAKIKTVCDYIYSDKGTVTNGIILIYTSYINAGIIPMELALEEMSFTR